MKKLTAYYDLAVAPPTFDFVGFLMAAERHRLACGLDAIDVVIVPGPQDGFRADKLPPFGIDARLRMRRNIVETMCHLLPSCRSVNVIDRAAIMLAGEIFPQGYAPWNPIRVYGTNLIIECARAGMAPLMAPGNAKRLARSVSMSLREASYWPTRNSNRVVWLDAAGRLAAAGWAVTIIPDVESEEFPAGPWSVNQLAAVDLLERARVYARSGINLFVNNGPAWMALFMKDVCSAIVRMEAEGAPCVSAEYFASVNLKPGTQIGRQGHYIAWAKEETAEAIIDCVEHHNEALAA